jgi:2-(1,2-epoxy-1,2-dihydrophenyl)acetyl-CoA isomerase
VSITASEDLRVEQFDGVTQLELNRPDALNAWTPQLGRDLLRALTEASADPGTRTILISGAGRAFSAGADLKVPREMTPEGLPDLSTRLREIYNPIVLTITGAPKPVIAAIQGAAAGLGAALALSCDFILAAESAYLLLPFVKLGLIPDAGGAYMLAERIGYGRAIQLSMLGERLKAQQGLEWGVFNAVHPDAELAEEARRLATELASGPTLALANMKRALRSGSRQAFERQLELEAELQQIHASSHDYPEGVAAFKEKRTPEFRGD